MNDRLKEKPAEANSQDPNEMPWGDIELDSCDNNDIDNTIHVDLNINIPDKFNSREELEYAANEIAKLAPPEYQNITKLYFCARYLVVVYEVAFAAIPVQVWNEYRNAFDHFIRGVTSTGIRAAGHTKKIAGHVQRAVLDISKLLCHDTLQLLEKQIASMSHEALSLVDNGDFKHELDDALENAQNKFIKAKHTDINLGDEARTNETIVGLYLDAVYASIDIQKILRERKKDIFNASIKHKAIQKEGAKEHVVLSLISKGIWYALAFFLGMAVLKAGYYYDFFVELLNKAPA